MVEAFAHLTGDTLWIHVDAKRAARGMPDWGETPFGLAVRPADAQTSGEALLLKRELRKPYWQKSAD